MTIKYIKNKNIDRVKWDFCIDNAANGTLYAYSWYLDTVAEHWDALISGDYEIIFPLTFVKKIGIKILYPPNSTQQLGIFSKELLPEEILSQFIKAIPKSFLFGSLYLNSGNVFAQNHKFHIEYRTNIEQNIGEPIHILRKKYGRNITENLRKARKNEIYVQPSTNYHTTIELYRANRGANRYYTSKNYYKSAYKLMATLSERQLLVIHEASNAKGECIASVIATPFKNRIVLLALGCNSEGYQTGATSLLLDSILEHFSEVKEICDFEGSNTKSVAYFYAGFGGHIVPYPELIVRNIPPILINLLYKVKQIMK